MLVDADERTTVAELAATLGQPDLYLGTRRLNDLRPPARGRRALRRESERRTTRRRATHRRASGGRTPGGGHGRCGPAAGARVDGRPGDVIAIGQSGRCQLRIDDPSVSRHHANCWRSTPPGRWIRDCGSSHGTGFGGGRVRTDQWMSPGRCGGDRRQRRDRPGVGPARDPPRPAPARMAPGASTRPPRIPGASEDPGLDPPAEPAVPTRTRFPLLSILAPTVIGGALALAFRNPMFLALVALSPVFAASNYVSDRRHGRADYGAKRAAYERARAAFDEGPGDAHRRRAGGGGKRYRIRPPFTGSPPPTRPGCGSAGGATTTSCVCASDCTTPRPGCACAPRVPLDRGRQKRRSPGWCPHGSIFCPPAWPG